MRTRNTLHVYFAGLINGVMKSTLKTTAAKLRSITQEKDSVWAEMLGRKVHSIRHLEAGSLKLSAALAARMNYESGISIKWLMDGDTVAPPVTADGKPFTKEVYDNARARKEHFATVKDDDLRSTIRTVLREVCAILVNANRKRNFHLAVYRAAKFIAELRDEFGEAKDFAGYETVLDYLGLEVRRWPILPVLKHLPEVVDLSSKPKSKRPLRKRRR
jgi:hypothetical protein